MQHTACGTLSRKADSRRINIMEEKHHDDLVEQVSGYLENGISLLASRRYTSPSTQQVQTRQHGKKSVDSTDFYLFYSFFPLAADYHLHQNSPVMVERYLQVTRNTRTSLQAKQSRSWVSIRYYYGKRNSQFVQTSTVDTRPKQIVRLDFKSAKQGRKQAPTCDSDKCKVRYKWPDDLKVKWVKWYGQTNVSSYIHKTQKWGGGYKWGQNKRGELHCQHNG
ncbi:hypothetical protein T265_02431 [Opisthorchis viverrini]|uniref:Uncharacterized protein n=1 Tax=Opisthorchis viverrini TaxID=6198 RepID=A0A074ZZ31_OPIVI|nr:hypothetical protein T265_02431 [Opisthorchis viverrini]KER31237.1 hypothetical protein T265_02431 [Opisthorchis viverrini]